MVGPGGSSSPAEQVETTLFRALAVLRLVVLVYAVAINVLRFQEFARPSLAVVVIVVLVGWTAFASWAYEAPRRRRLPLYLADLGVAVLLILSTPLVQSQTMLDQHASTMPTFWVMTPVLAWAAGRRWQEALLAAAVVSASDLSVRTAGAGWRVAAGGATWGNIFLLVLAAGIVAYTSGILRDSAEVRAAAERAEAAHAERARLARVVHDGVLQVLALVQRRGAEAGGDLAELGRLAGDQEAALRRLVQADARSLSLPGATAVTASADLMVALASVGTAAVTVTGPGHPVEVTRQQAQEVTAVVAACLDNVGRHVGEQASAWVLVEDLGDTVVVSVRDEGRGIPDGRLAEARAEGRLGVEESICGRMRDLGGRATLLTGPGRGTEWELTLPKA